MLLEGGGDAAQQLASALARLMDLDDLCLLQILQHLTPLPDLFHVALCNKRLRGLASGRRLFLVVHPDGPVSPEESQRLLHSPDQGSGGVASPAPRRFSSIEAAVQASRPGNTILLEPGTHTVTHTIRVPWPLHFVSDSTVADDTLLVAAHGLDTVFDFRCTILPCSCGFLPSQAPAPPRFFSYPTAPAAHPFRCFRAVGSYSTGVSTGASIAWHTLGWPDPTIHPSSSHISTHMAG
mmetsp:Transcript_21498/g.59748  ORF Transcript_21498/g.59748 Transcript_21498/m.59748 type:complete len:237 (-) Transcript_21498:766-1476(-)